MAGHPAAIVGLLDGLVNEWLLRALVLSSFMAHLVLVLLAGIRRHRASGGLRVLLWLAYQLATWSAPSALGKLFLGNTSRDERLHAFWMPILLMHLARPDNMSAYTLEDNVLAGRQLVDVPLQILGSSYALYKHIIIASDAGTLLPASCIMFSLGIAKYVENAFALWLGRLGSIRSSIKKLQKTGASINDDSGSWEGLDNERALRAAHRVLYISKGAFADYSFGKKQRKRDGSTSTSSKVFSHRWKDMYKVVEMELSLMYDIMYTKAAVVHTWIGYVIRLASPPLTAVALFLFFFFHSTDGQRIADVAITYILLIGTLVLDVGWLIRAVGSTWTYAFLKDNCLLRSSLLARWCGLRRFAVSLGPSRDPSSYRRWSGTIGQYNILHETTHDTTNPCSEILKFIGMDETGMEYQYSRGLEILPPVRDFLFEWIWEMLNPDVMDKKKEEEEKKKKEEAAYPVFDFVPNLGAGHGRRRALDEALNFGPEFQEIVLVWHIATDIFLLCKPEKGDIYNFKYVKAIEELSNYMMFLVVVRPNMLPGLKLRSLHDEAHDALKKIWTKKPGTRSCTARERELASILRKNMEGTRCTECKKSLILSDGTLYAQLMLTRLTITNWDEVYDKFSMGGKSKEQFIDLLRLSNSGKCEFTSNSPEYEPLTMQEMLELILDSWVRLLIYASIRCSRDSHAKQLSRGGELTTIGWMLAEHAGIYRIPV